MKTFHPLIGTGGCTKYICEYIVNIGKKICVVMEVNRQVLLVM